MSEVDPVQTALIAGGTLVWTEPLKDLLEGSEALSDPSIIQAAQELLEMIGPSQIAIGDQNVQVAGNVGTIVQGDYISAAMDADSEESRPSFQVVGGSVTNNDQVFAPGRNIIQFKGDAVADIQWRWSGAGFEMPWQQASAYQLEKRPLRWDFGRTNDPEEAQWGNEIILEIRYHWRGGWRLELHSFPLTRQHHPGKKVHMEMGREILPPQRLGE